MPSTCVLNIYTYMSGCARTRECCPDTLQYSFVLGVCVGAMGVWVCACVGDTGARCCARMAERAV